MPNAIRPEVNAADLLDRQLEAMIDVAVHESTESHRECR